MPAGRLSVDSLAVRNLRCPAAQQPDLHVVAELNGPSLPGNMHAHLTKDAGPASLVEEAACSHARNFAWQHPLVFELPPGAAHIAFRVRCSDGASVGSASYPLESVFAQGKDEVLKLILGDDAEQDIGEVVCNLSFHFTRTPGKFRGDLGEEHIDDAIIGVGPVAGAAIENDMLDISPEHLA